MFVILKCLLVMASLPPSMDLPGWLAGPSSSGKEELTYAAADAAVKSSARA